MFVQCELGSNRLLSDCTICTAGIHISHDGIGMMQEEPEKLAAYSSFITHGDSKNPVRRGSKPKFTR